MNNSLPQYIGAEQSVLGTIFLDSKRIVDVMDKISLEDFFDLKNQTIYKAMILAYNESINIDYTTVIAKLNQMGELGQAGGIEYVMELADHVPTTLHLEIGRAHV